MVYATRFLEDPLNDQQSIIVDEVTGERRHKDFPELWDLDPEDPDTILKAFESGLEKVGENGEFLGIPIKNTKGDVYSYMYKTYGQVALDAKKFAIFLEQEGLLPGEGIFGIYSANNYQYDVAIIGGYYRNLANCSLYDTLGRQAVKYICKETQMEVILVEDLKKLNILFSFDSPRLKTVVLMNETSEKIPEKEGIKVVQWKEALSVIGELMTVAPEAGDLATVIYTSGTAGNPKGVMLTHKALVLTALGNNKFGMVGQPFTSQDIFFSYLPLAHNFERWAHIMVMAAGGRLAYYGGDTSKMLAELALVRPTFLAVVPRVLNKIYDKINEKLSEPGFIAAFKSMLVRTAMSKKRAYLDQGIVTKDTFWDRYILSVLQAQFGGCVHTMFVGAAPLDPKVKGFIREAMSVYLVEGYGQTENCGATSGHVFANYCQEDGSVGTIAPSGGVKLIDVPEMNYKSKENKGEICYKGRSLMKGYFKQPEKTAETIDEDGWLHSGDIGEWTYNGCLRIIDRKKHMFKTQYGEYIAPERLEGILAKSPDVDQLFVYGNTLQE